MSTEKKINQEINGILDELSEQGKPWHPKWKELQRYKYNRNPFELRTGLRRSAK